MDRQRDLEAKPAALAEAQQYAHRIARGLEDSLSAYLHQPNANPYVLDNVRDILTNLSNALTYAGDQNAGPQRQADLKAVTEGAAMMLDPARDSRADGGQT